MRIRKLRVIACIPLFIVCALVFAVFSGCVGLYDYLTNE